MSDLLGAVSLSGAPITALLDSDSRQAMLAYLPGYPARVAEIATGPIWLCASSDMMVQNGEHCLAAEGWVAPGMGSAKGLLVTALEAARNDAYSFPAPDGHYVLAYADTNSGTVTLLRTPSGGERLYYF